MNEQIQTFLDRHTCTDEQQFRCLVEELGELSEAVNRYDEAAIREEIGDILFVLRTLTTRYNVPVDGAMKQAIPDAIGDSRVDQILTAHADDGEPTDYYLQELTYEVGELATCVHSLEMAPSKRLGGPLLVTHAFAQAQGFDGDQILQETVEENLKKDSETDGDKVTKATDE